MATGSMDTTAKLWDVESGEEVATLTVSYPMCANLLCPLTCLAFLSSIVIVINVIVVELNAANCS